MFLKRDVRYRHFLLKPGNDAAISRCNTRTCHNNVTPEYWIRYFDERLIFNKFDNISIFGDTDLSIEETVLRIMETSGSTN